MGRPKVIFFASLFVFNLVLFLFTLVVDANRANFDFLFALQGRIPEMKYFAAMGVGLSIAAFLIVYFSNQGHKKEIERLRNEQNDYKARLYDLQEEIRKIQDPEMVVDATDNQETEQDNNN